MRQSCILAQAGEACVTGTYRILQLRIYIVVLSFTKRYRIKLRKVLSGRGTDRKKEAFFELLAQRYPQYADKITGMALYQTNTPAERAA
nr:hypothetical protein BaRGS_030991 [Batillaria attramentaria]